MPKRKKTAASCLTDRCRAAAKKRGLCAAHYQLLWRAVKAGKASWRELEAAGLAAPLRLHPLTEQLQTIAARRATTAAAPPNEQPKAREPLASSAAPRR